MWQKFLAWLSALFTPAPTSKFEEPRKVIPIGELGTLKGYESRFAVARIRESARASLEKRATLIRKHQARYERVEALTGVPWWVIACIHNQELGSDVGVFRACLHNGERIIGTGAKTKIVPKGRGPFSTWEEAAVDALRYDHAFGRQWSIGHALEFMERYNGLGYLKRGIPSPYIWAMTDQYKKGHYIRDGVFDPEAVSKNFGVVALIKALEISVQFQDSQHA